MFHAYDSTTRLFLGQLGLLNKHEDEEAFRASLTARGIHQDIDELWFIHERLPLKERKAFFKNLPYYSKEAAALVAKRAKEKAKAEKSAKQHKKVVD